LVSQSSEPDDIIYLGGHMHDVLFSNFSLTTSLDGSGDAVQKTPDKVGVVKLEEAEGHHELPRVA
jgi:hypothetical protein